MRRCILCCCKPYFEKTAIKDFFPSTPMYWTFKLWFSGTFEFADKKTLPFDSLHLGSVARILNSILIFF